EVERLRAALRSAEAREAATADILGAIASSTTDLPRILNAIAITAARLCGAADVALLQLLDGALVAVGSNAGPAFEAISRALGVLTAVQYVVHPFEESQIRLLESFASQAVVAIENARLFQELAAERERSDRLLLNVLPVTIADRLKAGETPIVDGYPEATVVF